ncbi:MAG: hypothetical protein E7667_04990 [Ruminococcaceae bacterium]|nr:hypothetical protein [Oscillospiraceae bacterium]
MNFKNQIIVIALCYFISFVFLRGFLYGIKRYQLNNSAYKKRKKEESFKEWLFYNRYTAEIPKILRTLYCLVLISHPACLITCVIVHFIELSFNVGQMLAIGIAGFDVLWMLLIALLFWSPKPDFAYGRWIPKKKGQKHDKNSDG